jgi:Zn-dependent protease
MSLAHFVLSRVLSLVPLVLSLSVHEWAHAWAASRLGDTTAADQGRLTLNPLAHVDVVGTIALPLIGIPFGWAKPVPVEPTRFRPGVTMSRGMLLTAAAGPLSNFVLAAGCAGALAAGHAIGVLPAVDDVFESLLERAVLINVALGLFNLLPVPPLDGSRLVDAFVPFEHRATWRRVGLAFGVLLLIVLGAPIAVMGESLFLWVRSLGG